jgi:hypothetical protein
LPVGPSAGIGLSRFRERIEARRLVVHAQRQLHLQAMGEPAPQQQAFSGMIAWSAQRLQSQSARQSAIHRRPVRQRRFLQGSAGAGGGRPHVYGAGRSAGLRLPGAVIGYSFWQSEFGGDPAVLNRTVNLDGNTFPVVGVTAARLLRRGDRQPLRGRHPALLRPAVLGAGKGAP